MKNQDSSISEALRRALMKIRKEADEIICLIDSIEKPEKPKRIPDALLLTPIDKLDISVRSNNCLRAANIVFLGELVLEKKGKTFLKFRNFGSKSLKELEAELTNHGLSFGMHITKRQRKILEQKKLEYKNKIYK